MKYYLICDFNTFNYNDRLDNSNMRKLRKKYKVNLDSVELQFDKNDQPIYYVRDPRKKQTHIYNQKLQIAEPSVNWR